MLDPKQVVILSVPYCEPYPMVAPVLLSACLNSAGIASKGIDFSILFLEHFSSKPYYVNLKNFLTSYGMGEHRLDRAVLVALVERFNGGPVGLSTLAIAVGEETETVESVAEPFLVRNGFMARTPRGRVATAQGWRHIGRTPPAEISTLFDLPASDL
jgi:hypothetical protein